MESGLNIGWKLDDVVSLQKSVRVHTRLYTSASNWSLLCLEKGSPLPQHWAESVRESTVLYERSPEGQRQ